MMGCIIMSKRKRSVDVHRPAPPTEWLPRIIRSRYIRDVMDNDLVNELKWMHSMSPIDHIALELFSLVKNTWERRTENVIDCGQYPSKIMIWLGRNFPVVYPRELHITRYYKRNPPNYSQLSRTFVIVSLRTLETYLPDEKYKCYTPHGIYQYIIKIDGCFGYQYEGINNYAIDSIIAGDRFPLGIYGIIPNHLLEHYISAYVAYTVELMPREFWVKYFDWIIDRYRDVNRVSIPILSKYVRMHKL